MRVLREGDLAVLPLQNGFTCLSTNPEQTAYALDTLITLDAFLKDLDTSRIASDVLLERLAPPVQVIRHDESLDQAAYTDDQSDLNMRSLKIFREFSSPSVSVESKRVSQIDSSRVNAEHPAETEQNAIHGQADQSEEILLPAVDDFTSERPFTNLEPAIPIDGQGKARPTRARPRASPPRSFSVDSPKPFSASQLDQDFSQLTLPFEATEMSAIANIAIRGDPSEDTPVYTQFRMRGNQDKAV